MASTNPEAESARSPKTCDLDGRERSPTSKVTFPVLNFTPNSRSSRHAALSDFEQVVHLNGDEGGGRVCLPEEASKFDPRVVDDLMMPTPIEPAVNCANPSEPLAA